MKKKILRRTQQIVTDNPGLLKEAQKSFTENELLTGIPEGEETKPNNNVGMKPDKDTFETKS